MKKHVTFLVTTVLMLGGLLSAAPVDFAREILPILSNKCFVCHGPDGEKKDVLRLDSFKEATRDLDGYKAIDPVSPEKSELLVRLHDKEEPMPPKKAEKQLTKAEVDILTRWVKEGGKYAKHWAFVSPKKAKLAWKGNAIDAFVSVQLKQKKIGFATEADKATLARRVALVLTGLPPDPALLKKFLADKKPNAYERLVDELLASSRYGEHQARYWLDAVRYADTHGLHLDNKRGIYPYRDWVVRAFNQNQPLDEFLTWQLAGDLLPKPTIAQLVATGFVRMNPTTAEGGAIPAEFQAKNNFDRVETLGTVLLGMSLTCARCHTHKYDPIPQKEYYRMMAFFNSTAEPSMDGNKYEFGPTIKAPSDIAAWNKWE
jgi:cytochrome c553